MIQFSDSFSQELDENTLEKLIFCLEQTQDLQYAVVISEKLEDKVPTIGRNLWIGHLTYFSNDHFFRIVCIYSRDKGDTNSLRTAIFIRRHP
jgi:hypothetical protein